MRTGGQILVDALRIHGADSVFGVPGESALPIFDALLGGKRGVRFIVCRHEANAAHMAEADGKLRGEPGICIVSRGPGAMHAAVGVHTAFQDSTPMILIIGQVPRAYRGREAFQEIDYERVFAGLTKWTAEVPSADAIPEYMSRAFHIAAQGRAGPVVLSVPEDVLSEASGVADAPAWRQAPCAPPAAAMVRLKELIGAAERPLAILGGSGWSESGARKVASFCAENAIPVVAGVRAQDLVSNDEPIYAGDLSLGSSPALTERVKAADLLLVVGDRLGEVTSKAYAAIKPPRPSQRLIHVLPSPDELGRVYSADLPILSSMDSFADALSAMPPIERRHAAWLQESRAAYEEFQRLPERHAGFDLAKVILHLRHRLPVDAIVTNGAGNYSIWLHRFYRYRGFRTQLAPRSGAMGYGLSAAVAAKARFPERMVVGLAGDGCFQMSSPDFATAVHHKLSILMLVVNNGSYGSIRMHQEKHYPGRVSGTELTNPDFAALARAYGVHGEVVETEDAFPDAFERAVAAAAPAIVELRVPATQLTPDRVL